MISVLLAAGYATRLYPLTENFPKPLLPVGGSTILDRLVQDLDSMEQIRGHVVVTNHRFFDQFDAWRRSLRLQKPLELLDDGSTCNENRLGAVRDVQLAVERLNLQEELLVAAGDNLLDFSLRALAEHFEVRRASCVLCHWEERLEALRRTGVMVPDAGFRVLRMVEKPQDPPSHWAVPPFYLFAREDLPQIARGIALGCGVDAPGSFLAWLCEQAPVYALPMPGQRLDVGDVDSYRRAQQRFGC